MCGVGRNLGGCGAWSVLAFALGVAALSGCTSAYQSELFSFQASRASYPVMLSSVPHSGAGQPLVAHAEMSSGRVSAKTTPNTITTWTSSATSTRNVSDDLAHEVPPGARWVQINGLVYTGEDLLQSLGVAARRSSKRVIDIEGTTHR